MRNRRQKSLKVVLSNEQEQLARHVANMSSKDIEYIEWLAEEAEYALDNMILEQTGLTQAQDILSKFVLSKKGVQ